MKENWVDKGREKYWEIIDSSTIELRKRIEHAVRTSHKRSFPLSIRDDWNYEIPLILSSFDEIEGYIRSRYYDEVSLSVSQLMERLEVFDIALDDLWRNLKKSLSALEVKEPEFIYKESDLYLSPSVVHPVSDKLLKLLADNPRLLYDIEPRRFEEVVCELFRREGCDVMLTPETRDGGYDMVVFVRPFGVPFKLIVECKRYNPDKGVDISIMDRVLGAKSRVNAHKAMIVTTSYFTSEVIKQSKEHVLSLSTRDYCQVTDWLKRTVDPRRM